MKVEINQITDTEIFILQNNKVDEVINKAAFQQWVDNADKREWEMNWSDEGGNHRQDSGLMSWDDYYSSIYITNDIADYLTVREARTGKLRNMYDLGKGLSQILKTINK